MFQHVRIADGFLSKSAEQLAATAGGIITGLTGNPAFPSPPVELKTVQGAVDKLNAALAAQAHGGTAATAEKRNKYEVRSAAVGADNAPGSWQSDGLFTNSRSMTVAGLVPGTTYSFQVRAVGGSTRYSDWSNPVSRMCA